MAARAQVAASTAGSANASTISYVNGGWTESSLETRVGVLAARLEGRAFVDAIGELAATLDDDERAILREILLRRAKEEAAHGYPFAPRLDEPRWRLFGPRSREPGRD